MLPIDRRPTKRGSAFWRRGKTYVALGGFTDRYDRFGGRSLHQRYRGVTGGNDKRLDHSASVDGDHQCIVQPSTSSTGYANYF